MKGTVVIEIKAPFSSGNISDFIHEKVIEKAMELMKYNLDLQAELENNFPFPSTEEGS